MKLIPYFKRKFRWVYLLLILFACLIISFCVLFLNVHKHNVINFCDYSIVKQDFPSFIDYNKNRPADEFLKQNIKSTITKPVQSPNQETFISENKTRYDKYLLAIVNEDNCGGIGNVIFRIASLYGIGKKLKRNVCLQGSCGKDYHIELYSMFSHLHNFPLLRDCWNTSFKGVDFAGNTWSYENTSRLNQYNNETFITLQTNYLQSHKFFHHIRDEILYMFDFSGPIKSLVDDYAGQMFDNDNSIKICAHMRQGDFNGKHPLLASTEVFTVSALNYLINSITNESGENIRIILFSDDNKFANKVVEELKKIHPKQKAFVTQQLNRLENIALATRHCDYFLITSSGSTFGWWMGYLLPDEKQANIYYNSLFFKEGNEDLAKDFHEEDFFPPKWNRLVFNLENTTITIQNRSIPAITIVRQPEQNEQVIDQKFSLQIKSMLKWLIYSVFVMTAILFIIHCILNFVSFLKKYASIFNKHLI